jgi:Icc-related predicted phosphoesterase
VLDGTAVEISGIGFAGAKGFAGGFGERALQAWGESATKIFVREAVDEALKLESALARLRTPGRVVLLHYAPVLDTVDGEPREIYPFLGSSRLEEPLNRYAASVVFHGHAHRGQPEGKTAGGVPVYNVALPLLQRLYPDRSPFRVVEIPAQPAMPAPPPITVHSDQAP